MKKTRVQLEAELLEKNRALTDLQLEHDELKARAAALELRANVTVRVLEGRRDELETRLVEALVEANLLKKTEP